LIDCILLTEPRFIAESTDPYVQQVFAEDAVVVDALRAAGLRVERRSWDDPSIDWSMVRCGLVRTTWDYHHRWPVFDAWLTRVAQTTPLINAAGVLRWNLDKRYLLDLAEAGVQVVPTRVAARGSGASLAIHGPSVIKPVVSAAGRETHRVHPGAEAEALWDRLLEVEDMMVQPFVESVLGRGEVSLMVIDGEVTHAVQKIAAPGEFRVQDDHGGTVHAYTPTAAERELAARAMAAAPDGALYGRVDLVNLADGTPAVMELELVEPEMFFRFGPGAAERMAAAVARSLKA